MYSLKQKKQQKISAETSYLNAGYYATEHFESDLDKPTVSTHQKEQPGELYEANGKITQRREREGRR